LLVQTLAELEDTSVITITDRNSDFDKKIAKIQPAVKTKSAQVAEVQLEMSKTEREIEKFHRDKLTSCFTNGKQI